MKKPGLALLINEPLALFMSGAVCAIMVSNMIGVFLGRHERHVSFGVVGLMFAAFIINATYAVVSFAKFAHRERHHYASCEIMNAIIAQMERDGLVRIEPHALAQIRRDFNSKLN